MSSLEKRIFFIGFAIILSCISILLFLEIICRLVIKQPYYAFPDGYFINNKFYGYELARDFKGTYSQPEYTISVDTNSDGLRDTEHPRLQETFRILSLGDSYTFGVGVGLGDTYLSLLERMLNDNAQGREYSIIKAGVVGYSTYNERVYLEKRGILYRPQLVMVQFWWDDLGVDRITYLADTGLLSTPELVKFKNFAQFRLFLNRHLRSYAFLRRVYITFFKRSLFPRNIRLGLVADTQTLKAQASITINEFNKIRSFCKDNNAACLFLLIPPKEFVYSYETYVKGWNFFCVLLEQNNIAYIDLLPSLKEAVNKGERPFFSVDFHLNREGHRIVASRIYDYLSALGY